MPSLVKAVISEGLLDTLRPISIFLLSFYPRENESLQEYGIT